jgi:hypothetical protein
LYQHDFHTKKELLMKKSAFGIFAFVALCLPSVVFCQEDESVKKPVSPEVLWLAYMKKEPTTQKLYFDVLGNFGRESAYRDFAALEILRRGNGDMDMLREIIAGRSESARRLAWEMFKKKASNEDLCRLLGQLNDTKLRCFSDEWCREVSDIWLQNAVELFWTRERSNEDRAYILKSAPYEKEKIRAAEELFDHHPNDHQLARILISSPSRRQGDRVVDIIRLRKDFDESELHSLLSVISDDFYLSILNEIYAERFGDPDKFYDDQPKRGVKQVVLDLSDLDEMTTDTLLEFMNR